METKTKQEQQYSYQINRLWNKGREKRQRRTLHNDQGSIEEEDITIINIYAPNIGALQYVRQVLTSMKGEINNNTIIVGDFNTPTHIWIDQLNRKLTGKHKP